MSESTNEATSPVLAAFDNSKAAEALRDRLRAAFMELIPAEQVEAMIRAEFQRFATGGRDRWGHETRPELPGMLHAIVREEMRAQIGTLLREDPAFKERISSAIGEAVKLDLAKLMQDFIVSGLSTYTENAITNYLMQRRQP
jgi:hypothetical protein